MSDQFSQAYVRRVAHLSRLALSDAELDDARARLSAIVTYMERLRALDLAGLEPLTNVGGGVNRLGEDEPGPLLPRAALEGMAPAFEDGFVKVPRVLDGGGA